MTIPERIRYWQASAESDLNASCALFANGNYLHMGFFCHLAVEKSMKAYHWHAVRSEPPYIHNLMKLAEDSGLHAIISQEQKELIATLMPLNLKGRYPDDQGTILANLTGGEFEDILRRTKEFCEWMQHLTEK